MSGKEVKHQRQWRKYRTGSGTRPVSDFLFALPDEDRTTIIKKMEYVRIYGKSAARHLRQDIYEVRINYDTKAYRILFACEGHFNHILLSLEGFQKKTQQTPKNSIQLAEQRLADWRRRGNAKYVRERIEGEKLMEQDFLDEMIEESTKRNPEFPVLMDEAHQRLALLHDLATLRTRAGISKKTVAKRLKISRSDLADLEESSVDPYLSTVQRYAAIIGKRLEWRLVDAPSSENVETDTPPVS